jgi:ferritin-like metal-binding protein YciE
MPSIAKHREFIEISFLINAENQITEVLRKMIKASGSDENKLALENLSQEIKNQIEKIKRVKLQKVLFL